VVTSRLPTYNGPIVSRRFLIVVVAVVIALGGAALLLMPGDGLRPAPPAPGTGTAEGEAAGGGTPASDLVSGGRAPDAGPTWRLVVIVTDAEGRAVEGASAGFLDGRGDFTWLDGGGSSDAAGRLEGDVAGSGRLLVAGPDGGSRALVEDVGAGPAGGGREVTVRLTPGRPLSGLVTAPEGDGTVPVAARVRAELLDPGDWDTVEYADAGDDGRFEFASLPPGRYELVVFPLQAGRFAQSAEPVVAEAGSRGVDLRVQHMAAVWLKIVETGEDAPERGPADVAILSAAGAVVGQWYGLEGEGALRCPMPAGAKYRVTVDCPGWRLDGTGEFTIAPGAWRVDVTAEVRFEGGPGAVLELIVHDESGEPVRRIGIGAKENRWPQRTRLRELEGNGYRLRLSPGNWCVMIGTAAGGEGPWLTQVLDLDLEAGETMVREVELIRGGWATFRYPYDGRTDLEVIEGPECPEPSRDSRYRLTPDSPRLLAAGHWLVELRAPGVDPVRREFDLPPGGSVEIDFR
jgi:hypothetical protein